MSTPSAWTRFNETLGMLTIEDMAVELLVGVAPVV
jgi:hypothetical protein